MTKFRLSIILSFLIAPTLAIADLYAFARVPIFLASNEANVFWCRKTYNRECNINKSKCEMLGNLECFSRPTAWCFQAQIYGNPELVDQMICVAHKLDCEDWWKGRSNDPTGKCLERNPDEYPISQTK